MDYLVLCGASLLAIFLILVLKQMNSTYALFLAVLFGIILIRQALNTIGNELEFFKEITQKATLTEVGNLILKIFGISLIVETTSDICRDSGESSIASKVELIGKAEILVLTIPLIKEILKIIENIML